MVEGSFFLTNTGKEGTQAILSKMGRERNNTNLSHIKGGEFDEFRFLILKES